MNDIERNNLMVELTETYAKAMAQANDLSRDGLAQYLFAAQAQYKMAELAISEEEREMHLKTANTLRELVQNKKIELMESSRPEA